MMEQEKESSENQIEQENNENEEIELERPTQKELIMSSLETPPSMEEAETETEESSRRGAWPEWGQGAQSGVDSRAAVTDRPRSCRGTMAAGSRCRVETEAETEGGGSAEGGRVMDPKDESRELEA
jgi:hypothetical protein